MCGVLGRWRHRAARAPTADALDSKSAERDRQQTMPVSGQTRVAASSRQVACEVGGEMVILHLDDGLYYSLNEVGACVWQLVQEPRCVDELVDAITAQFDVERDQCLADIQALVVDLAEHQLVTLSPADER